MYSLKLCCFSLLCFKLCFIEKCPKGMLPTLLTVHNFEDGEIIIASNWTAPGSVFYQPWCCLIAENFGNIIWGFWTDSGGFANSPHSQNSHIIFCTSQNLDNTLGDRRQIFNAYHLDAPRCNPNLFPWQKQRARWPRGRRAPRLCNFYHKYSIWCEWYGIFYQTPQIPNYLPNEKDAYLPT